ncbi:MAG: hypothetical protein ACTSPI_11595 [Candidatus Heimdallarchaeaceae archaeon]
MQEALELNALHYPITTISGVLTNLTKKGKVRRIKKGKLLSYVVSKSR